MKCLVNRVLYYCLAFSCLFIGGTSCSAVPENYTKKVQATQATYGPLVLYNLNVDNDSVLVAIEKLNQAVQGEGIEGFVFVYDLDLDLKFSKDSRERFVQLQKDVRNISIESGAIEEVAHRVANAYGLTFGYGDNLIYFYPRELFEVKHNLNLRIAPKLSDDSYIGSIRLVDLITAINAHLIAHRLEIKVNASLSKKQEEVFLSSSGSMPLGEILDSISMQLNARYYYSDEVIHFSP